jgi:cytochrome c biogenesis protein CcmG, thiol:disulfide interchange protein DsbE
MRGKSGRTWQVAGVVVLILMGIEWGDPVRAPGGGAGAFQAYAKPLALPDFSLEDLEGKTVRIKDYKGKVILLNFWATWCSSCRKEAPSLEKLYGQYHSKNFVLFRIGTKESRETVAKFLEKNPLRLPILLDKKNKVGKLLGVWVHPTSYLVDKKGMLRYRSMGPADWAGPEAAYILDRLTGEE